MNIIRKALYVVIDKIGAEGEAIDEFKTYHELVRQSRKRSTKSNKTKKSDNHNGCRSLLYHIEDVLEMVRS